MKLIEGTLWIEFADFLAAGWKEDTIKKANLRNGENWQMIENPADKRMPLVQYETLRPEHKHKLQLVFKDPYQIVAKEPIKKIIEKDLDAERFFLQYRYDNGTKSIPGETIKKYVNEASWMKMIIKATENKAKIIKTVLNISKGDFYTHVCELLEIERKAGRITDKFPTTYQRLNARVQKLKEEGYNSIIHPAFGNKVAAKINDEISVAQLIVLIEDEHQHDDVIVCVMYNKWAVANGYKTISVSTVTKYRAEYDFEAKMNREGNSAFNETFIRQVKGKLPSAPLFLVEHDDNNLDFLFKDESGYAFNKYVSIAVIDSRTKLLLGKSILHGKKPEQWQLYHAYIDAMYYIRSLTGGWHLPFEIKCDKWASKAFEPFYNKIGKYVPPAHGNKHRGYIEQFFGSPHWKRAQKLVSQGNWTGNNITAKNRGVNTEALANNAKTRPMIGAEAELQIEQFFHLLRKMPQFTRENMNAPSAEQRFIEEWNKLSIEDKRPINDEQFLLTFGIKHRHQNTITNRGIEPTITKELYSYDLPEAWMYKKYRGAKCDVIYDPYDMSRVLVTNNDDIRFIAHTAQLSPRALKDATCGSRTFLNAILTEKKEMVADAADRASRRKQIVDRSHYNAEAMLQGNVMVKELKYEAEQQMLEDFSNERESWLNEANDFSEFFK